MSQQNNYKPLTKDQIRALESQGCSARDWNSIQVTDTGELSGIRNTQFFGKVAVGKLSGKVTNAGGPEKPCGIYNATIGNCTIADSVRICNAGHIASYDIEDGACIEDVGTMQTNAGATFGNGVEVAVLNEAGGREVVLFNELDAQFAYLMCLHRYKPGLFERLKEIVNGYIAKITSGRGRVGIDAKICRVGEIADVNIGAGAVIDGASSLVNGTVLSGTEAVTTICNNVVAKDFIIAECTSVTSGAQLEKVYVGQGCKIGKGFSAENSLFFANCEAFHGEAVSVFAGPYTVTHHKSTLLIAGLFSFYNAGSGTNQSNHMYKLGPAHEGKLERGCKTGSFSYMIWPCNIGPFSVVIGKHMRNFDTSDFPFAHLEAEPNGVCSMVPGMHLITVGTVRDGAKWPDRDRRKVCKKRDRISFDVFSPYTVGKMIKASAKLKELQDSTDKSVERVNIGGAQTSRVLLRISRRFYRTGIEVYLGRKLLERCEQASAGLEAIRRALANGSDAVYSEDWVDIAGQLMPKKRLDDLTDAIEKAAISDIESLNSRLDKIYEASAEDEWLWVKNTYKQIFDTDLDTAGADELIKALESHGQSEVKFLKQVLVDARKEFSRASRLGFGKDGSAQDVDADFEQVRGRYEENKFVKDIQQSIGEVVKQTSELKDRIRS